MKQSILIKIAKILYIPILAIFLSFSAQASHIMAGNIYYKSDTTSAQNPLRVFITLVTYSNSPHFIEDEEATLYFGDCANQRVTRATRTLIESGQNRVVESIYRFDHTYASSGSYTATYIVDSQQGGIVNISGSTKPNFFLQSTITVDLFLGPNRSPIFQNKPIINGTQHQVLLHNSSVIDADGDSLSFKLLLPKTSNGFSACGNPVGAITPGISGLENFVGTPQSTHPAGLTFSQRTGLLTWNTPTLQGAYNIAVQVEEWRNRVLIGTIVRDMLLYVGASTVTGLSEEVQQQFTIYPNPASTVVHVKAPTQLQIYHVEVFTGQGKKAKKVAFDKPSESWTLNIGDLPQGVYIVKLQTSQGLLVRRLTVTR